MDAALHQESAMSQIERRTPGENRYPGRFVWQRVRSDAMECESFESQRCVGRQKDGSCFDRRVTEFNDRCKTLASTERQRCTCDLHRFGDERTVAANFDRVAGLCRRNCRNERRELLLGFSVGCPK